MPEALKRTRTQIERREEAISRMVDSAIELIANKGIQTVTMAEIGVHAGYSRGLPYQHFGTKEKIIEAILESVIERFNARRKHNNAPQPGLESIKSLVSTYLDREEADWTLSKAFIVIMAEASLPDSKHRELVIQHNRKNLQFLKKHLRIARENREIQSTVPDEDLAVILMGTMRGIVLQTLSDKEINLQSLHVGMLKVLDVTLGA
ncbi:HTH-type transcriptional regulator SrpR [bioreactor metagenome]|uniref:HTH-type transcriptional regulator SrpR n=1 Tax=bioreactor metagenome TaxID=1076179 RepID=A0A644Y8I3_9ZZZZ